jgi:hypothetical protein
MKLSDIYYSVLVRIPEVDVPKPENGGSAPDDLVKEVVQALNLISWVGTAAGVVGVLVTGTTMAVSHKRGESSEHMSRLGMVLGGCILIATGGHIVGWIFNQ